MSSLTPEILRYPCKLPFENLGYSHTYAIACGTPNILA